MPIVQPERQKRWLPRFWQALLKALPGIIRPEGEVAGSFLIEDQATARVSGRRKIIVGKRLVHRAEQVLERIRRRHDGIWRTPVPVFQELLIINLLVLDVAETFLLPGQCRI